MSGSCGPHCGQTVGGKPFHCYCNYCHGKGGRIKNNIWSCLLMGRMYPSQGCGASSNLVRTTRYSF